MKDTAALLAHIRLRFNLDHPSVEECYLAGYESGFLGSREEDHPFSTGSQEAKWWLEGWWAGMYEEEPLFDKKALYGELDYKDPTEARPAPSANDQQYSHKHSFLFLVFEIGGALAASVAVGYQLFELVA